MISRVSPAIDAPGSRQNPTVLCCTNCVFAVDASQGILMGEKSRGNDAVKRGDRKLMRAGRFRRCKCSCHENVRLAGLSTSPAPDAAMLRRTRVRVARH